MRVAIIAGPMRVRVERRAVPEPGPGEVLVRLAGCGVCGSNVPVWEGRPWFQYPMAPGAPGHEGWGRVERWGDGVTGFATGQRVALLSTRAFAEYDIAPATAIATIPDHLGDHAFPGEPLACAFNVFRRCAVRDGEIVAIVGVGFLGAILVALAAAAGARVIALSRRPFALHVARRFGAAETIQFTDWVPAVERVRVLTDGAGCECVIEAAGVQETLDLASAVTRERGRRGGRARRATAADAPGRAGGDGPHVHAHARAARRLHESRGHAVNTTALRVNDAVLPDRADGRRPRVGFLGVGWIGRHRLQAIADSEPRFTTRRGSGTLGLRARARRGSCPSRRRTPLRDRGTGARIR